MNNRPENQKSSDGLMLPIFAVAAVFLFIVLCFYAYNHINSNKNSDGVVVLEGSDNNFKVTPSDPGGMQVAHTDKEIFNTVTGAKEDIEGEQVNVVEAENPVSKESLESAAPAADGVPAEAVNAETAPVEQSAVESLDAPSVAAETTPAAEVVPEAVKLSENKDTVKEEVKAEAKPAAKIEKKAEVKQPAKTTKFDVKKETDKKTGDTKTVVSFRDPPKSLAGKAVPASAKTAAPKTAESANYFVQINSSSSRSEAESTWKKFYGKFASEIKGANKNITEANIKGKTYYRLSFGPFKDKAGASTKCGILKTKGQDCIVQKY